jgi:hypothetical protein
MICVVIRSAASRSRSVAEEHEHVTSESMPTYPAMSAGENACGNVGSPAAVCLFPLLPVVACRLEELSLKVNIDLPARFASPGLPQCHPSGLIQGCPLACLQGSSPGLPSRPPSRQHSEPPFRFTFNAASRRAFKVVNRHPATDLSAPLLDPVAMHRHLKGPPSESRSWSGRHREVVFRHDRRESAGFGCEIVNIWYLAFKNDPFQIIFVIIFV